MQPIKQLSRDLKRAEDLDDPMANLIVVATVNSNGEPKTRAVVLREVRNRLAFFCNATSPKVSEFFNSNSVAIWLYLPTLRVQYRLVCSLEPIPSELVKTHWRFRTDVAKRLEAAYSSSPQGSKVESRAWLAEKISSLPVPLQAPESAIGFFLNVVELERLALGVDDQLHDRRRYKDTTYGWIEEFLVP